MRVARVKPGNCGKDEADETADEQRQATPEVEDGVAEQYAEGDGAADEGRRADLEGI